MTNNLHNWQTASMEKELPNRVYVIVDWNRPSCGLKRERFQIQIWVYNEIQLLFVLG